MRRWIEINTSGGLGERFLVSFCLSTDDDPRTTKVKHVIGLQNINSVTRYYGQHIIKWIENGELEP